MDRGDHRRRVEPSPKAAILVAAAMPCGTLWPFLGNDVLPKRKGGRPPVAARPCQAFISLLPQRRLVVSPRILASDPSIISALECSVGDVVPSVERWPGPQQ